MFSPRFTSACLRLGGQEDRNRTYPYTASSPCERFLPSAFGALASFCVSVLPLG